MRIRTKREQVTLVVGALIVIGLLIWSALNPAKHSGSGDTLLPVTTAQHKQDLGEREMRRLALEKGDLEPRIASMSFSEPGEQITPQVVNTLERVAESSGVHLSEVKPEKPQMLPSGAGSRVSIDVRFKAQFQPNVVQFLFGVENPANRMVVDRLNIGSADPRFQSVDVSARISAYTRSVAGAGGEGSDNAPQT